MQVTGIIRKIMAVKEIKVLLFVVNLIGISVWFPSNPDLPELDFHSNKSDETGSILNTVPFPLSILLLAGVFEWRTYEIPDQKGSGEKRIIKGWLCVNKKRSEDHRLKGHPACLDHNSWQLLLDRLPPFSYAHLIPEGWISVCAGMILSSGIVARNS